MHPERKPRDDREAGDEDEEHRQAARTWPKVRTECPWCGNLLKDPFVCDYCEWGAGGEA